MYMYRQHPPTTTNTALGFTLLVHPQEDMRKLVNNRELSDVTFIVDGFPVYASRVHLALRSEHFRAMLYGGMRESEKGAEIEIKVCMGWDGLLFIVVVVVSRVISRSRSPNLSDIIAGPVVTKPGTLNLAPRKQTNKRCNHCS